MYQFNAYSYHVSQLPTPFGTLTYTVQPGDTLGKIARDYVTTVHNILLFNRIPDPDFISPGQTIIIPLSPPESILYTVRPGDSLYSISNRFGTGLSLTISINYLFPPYIIYPGQQLVVNPSLR
ncbi:LysM peptidoglycan-binding domain-containing protein [Heliobacterium chlorum]|uniref:LysM peptidoglycan-binding domain-containing protein n=1 Tax=Heliobacterium chlorum TaxID=2698 RepID=A0ABR7SZA6_HELCL|nr:LysM domain-containing protein [Heliobacterium chlorum]MBC9783766.1 LysM peptidoglycan-binding domain-containing protein [Heliobacterium chlorum]